MGHESVAHSVDKQKEQRHKGYAQNQTKPQLMLGPPQPKAQQDKQDHGRDRHPLHSHHKEKAARAQKPVGKAFFLFGAARRKGGVVNNELPEHKGEIVDLQTAGVALGIAKGQKTGNQRLDARHHAIVGNLQQHDRAVGDAQSQRKQMDALFPEQVDGGDRRHDCNGLVQDFGKAAGHRGGIDKIHDPNRDRPQQKRRNQRQIRQRGRHHPLCP